MTKDLKDTSLHEIEKKASEQFSQLNLDMQRHQF